VVAKVEKDITDGVKDAVSIPAKDSDAEDIKKAVIKNVLWQMDHDRKTTSLKQLQGHIWREAYNSGELIGE
jgi:methionine salvage enolase-phosphatase E1